MMSFSSLYGFSDLGDAVINDDAPIRVLNRSHMRLDEVPQVGGGELPVREEPLYPVVADATTQQGSQPGACGLAEGANQIVRVQVQQLFVIHPFSLSHPLTA